MALPFADTDTDTDQRLLFLPDRFTRAGLRTPAARSYAPTRVGVRALTPLRCVVCGLWGAAGGVVSLSAVS